MNTSDYYYNQINSTKKDPLKKNPLMDETAIAQNPAGIMMRESELTIPELKTDENIGFRTTLPEQKPGFQIGDLAPSAGEIMNFGMDIYKATEAPAQNEREANMKAANLAVSGASTGASIGSAIAPGIGTAIGAAGGLLVGGVSGLLMKPKERRERVKKAEEEYMGKLFQDTENRRITAEASNREQELEYLRDLQRSQVGQVRM